MARPRPPRVVLSERERADLERLVRAYTTGQQLALRARIVLLAGDGWNNLQIARELGADDETPVTGEGAGCSGKTCRWRSSASRNGWPMDHDQAHRRSSHL